MAFSLMQMVRPDNINVELTLLRILPGHSSLVLQIRSLSWSVFSRIRTEYLSVFSPNTWKYGPVKILYLDTFHAVGVFYPIWGDWFYHATVGVGVFYPIWGDWFYHATVGVGVFYPIWGDWFYHATVSRIKIRIHGSLRVLHAQ